MHPPVLLVFHQVGKRSAKSQMEKVADLTRHHWQGRWHREGGFHSYDGCIPVVATTLELLHEHGPAGPAFWSFGRKERQSLLDAIGTPAGTLPSPAAAKPPGKSNSAARSRARLPSRRAGVCPVSVGDAPGLSRPVAAREPLGL
ncbi:hypothetical protein OHU25_03200 [Streptomyces sp. NBC_00117]|uniref:hypothetical protein n=1 Tax=Streptomyces TaxID=1883 RepID=UPI002E25A6DD|nr:MULTISPECIES: hypothetical protein [unclassified Streptomyces]